MRHVLGMAKRHLDLRGAKGPKLELDFLRLAVAVAALRRRGDDAKGYLLVMTPAIKERTGAWAKKYETGDTIEVVVPPLTSEEIDHVRAEVRANVDGMVAGTQGQPADGRSDARRGSQLAEDKLRAFIETHEPGVQPVRDRSRVPLDIRWDFYGIVAAICWNLQHGPHRSGRIALRAFDEREKIVVHAHRLKVGLLD
jgi:hypothetical protein